MATATHPALLTAPIFHQHKTRTTVSVSSMQGVFAESSLRKQAWRNPKEGRMGCLHQNIFTRKVTDIAFTSDFCSNYSHSASPASPSHTSPRPILDVLKSLVSRPHVPSPHTRVPMSPSPCLRPTFIHSQFKKHVTLLIFL